MSCRINFSTAPRSTGAPRPDCSLSSRCADVREIDARASSRQKAKFCCPLFSPTLKKDFSWLLVNTASQNTLSITFRLADQYCRTFIDRHVRVVCASVSTRKVSLRYLTAVRASRRKPNGQNENREPPMPQRLAIFDQLQAWLLHNRELCRFHQALSAHAVAHANFNRIVARIQTGRTQQSR